MKVGSGGGFRAIWYTFKKGRQAGGVWKLYQAMRSKNACKTCALGMGGQQGGMTNEKGSFPELCKKSLQAMVADMQPGIPPTFWAEHSVADMQRMSPRELEHCGRLIQPVLYQQGATHYRPITWAEAYDKIASKLNSVQPNETFWYFSGRSSNEAGFLLQLLARLYGTNNVNNCSYYCHQASGVGLQSSVGTGTATISLEDLEQADCVFVIGGNPASNHPRLMTSLMHVRRRGGHVIVINPVEETGMVRFRIPSDMRSLFGATRIASMYIQPHIGGDLALLWASLKRSVNSTHSIRHSYAIIVATPSNGSARCSRSSGQRSKRNQASIKRQFDKLRLRMPKRNAPCFHGPWGLRTMSPAWHRCKPLPVWRCVEACLAVRAAG